MKLLNVTDAAIHLGITKELLFAYIRNSPKKHLGEDRKLFTIVKEGQNFFEEEELRSFDEYLKMPWSKSGQMRPPIPRYIKEYLKVEIGGKCPITGKGYPLDDAHIIPYSQSLNHHHHNIIRVAKEEHTKADTGVIPNLVLRDAKDKLIEALRTKLRHENKPYSSLFQPPNPHPIFIGRIQKLLQLTEAMEFQRFVIVEGMGGVGKTQLLLQAIDNVQYHNPVIWVDVESVGNIADLILILKSAISEHYGIGDSNSILDSLKEVSVTFIFDSLEKLLLNERDETEDFIKALLTQTKYMQLLVTSQIDLSISDLSKKIIKVKGLETEESIILIKELIDEEIRISQENLYWIIDFCNGHPLSIKLICAIIQFFKSSERAIQLLKESRDLKHPTRIKHDKLTSLSVCLSTIYDTLTIEQKRILHFLKFFPAGLKLKWAEEKFKESTFINDVSVLQQFFFIEIKEDQLDFERLFIPNPIRPFLKEKADQELAQTELETEKEAIIHIMMEAATVDLHYIESGLSGQQSYGIMRTEDEMPNLLAAFNIAQAKSHDFENLGNTKLKEEYLSIIAGIAGALGKYCFTKGDFEYGTLFSSAGIDANIKLNHIDTASTQYMYLGQIQCRQYDNSGFADTVKKMQKLAQTTGNTDAKIDAAWSTGRLQLNYENFQAALTSFDEAYQLMQKKIGIEHSVNFWANLDSEILKKYAWSNTVGNLALVTTEIAKVYEFSKNYLKAIEYYKKAIEIQKQFGDEINLMSSYHHIANCLTDLGQLDEGLKFYFISIEGFKRNKQYEYLANSISELGKFVQQQPTLATHVLLDEETLALALNSISYQLLEYIKRASSNEKDFDKVIQNIPYQLWSKSVLMIMIVGFSPISLILSKWISDLTKTIDLQKIKPGIFSAMLNLGYAIGGVNEWQNLPENRPIMIKSILQGCLLINGGPDLKSQTRIFYWLASWMQYTSLDKEATAEKLLNEAWGSFDK